MHKNRALVLIGAGASLEFGAPSTSDLTNFIEKKIFSDDWMRHKAGDHAWSEIKHTLSGYFKHDADNIKSHQAVNFEHIYHCAHELLSTFEPAERTVNEFRPVLVPFIKRHTNLGDSTLKALVNRIAEFIFAEMVTVCERAKCLNTLTAFLAKLRQDYIVRIYTTNYDDFLLQAAPDLFTGFDPEPRIGAKPFDRQKFWNAIDQDCSFPLHGSVHLSFRIPHASVTDINALYWYDSRDEALLNSSYSGSDDQRMDGGKTVRSAIITGLDKLAPLQRQPFSHYYASMARDAMEAEIIFVIGCGLGDLHLNTWLGEARRRDPMPPLVFIDYWSDSFLCAASFELGRKEIEMSHTLCMPFMDYGVTEHCSGWNLDKRGTYAIWDKGFSEFLKAQGELENILGKLL